MNRMLLIAVVLVGLVAAGGATMRWFSVPSVTAVRVELGTVQTYVDERAKTRLPKVYRITLPVAGRIETIALDEGQPVKKGQVVARMVRKDLDLMLAEAQAKVAHIQAQIRENDDQSIEQLSLKQVLALDTSMKALVENAVNRMTSGKEKQLVAQRHFMRIDALFARGATTEEALDQARLGAVEARVEYDQDRLVHAATLAMQVITGLMPQLVKQTIANKTLSHDVLVEQLAEAKAQLEQTRNDVDRGSMTSPVDGVVLERHYDNEQTLAAGTVLLTIGDLRQLEVEAEILTQDAARIHLGDAVEINGPAIGRKPVQGKVVRVYPAGFTKVSSLGVEQQRVLVIVSFDDGELVRLRSERQLGVGYRVSVRIETGRADAALHIPRSALFRSPRGTWQVYAVRDGAARLQDVELGITNDQAAQIIDGLESGETVILGPENDIADGQRVQASIVKP